jgi:flavin reductase (DIM6/NTAB) family NADH-FMN oxidoreductase RutF
MYLDLESGRVDWRDAYKLFLGFVNPRPIALVSTLSADGRENLAPFSFYNMVSANPPVVIVCPSTKRDRGGKDTLVNIEQTREFAIATVTEAIAEPMARCAATLPYGQSEFDFSGLTPIPAAKIKPPLVRESPVNIECRLRQLVRIGDQTGGGSVVFGDVIAVHIAEWTLAADGATIDPHKLRTVGRLGGKGYTTVTDPYELDIPEVGSA